MNASGEKAPAVALAHPGDIVAEKYRVERVLGEGGMAVVYAAQHLQLDHPVALKVLKPAYVSSAEALARFLREARSAARLTSEHVAKVIDVGTLDSGVPYLVMEYLRGEDLASVLGSRRRIPCREAVDLVLQATEALAEAHSQGIIHRDIKPENLFISKRSDGAAVVKVLDFGIAKAAEGSRPQSQPGMTQPSTSFGSPAYMSPEQVRSACDVDARADIWALGVILYELVSGRQPFAADSAAETCAVVLRDSPCSLGELRPELAPGFVAAVHKCLEKDRDARYLNVSEFAAAFAPYGGKTAAEYAARIRVVIESACPTLPPSARTSIADNDSDRETASQIVLAATAPDDPARLANGLATSTTVRLGKLQASSHNRRVAYAILGAFALLALAAVVLFGPVLWGHPQTASRAGSSVVVVSAAPSPSEPESVRDAELPEASAVSSEEPTAAVFAPVPLASSARAPFGKPPGAQPSPTRKRNDLYGTRK